MDQVRGVEAAAAEADALRAAHLDRAYGSAGAGAGGEAGRAAEGGAEDVRQTSLQVEEEQPPGRAGGAVGDAHQARAGADGHAVRRSELGCGRRAAGRDETDELSAGIQHLDPAGVSLGCDPGLKHLAKLHHLPAVKPLRDEQQRGSPALKGSDSYVDWYPKLSRAAPVASKLAQVFTPFHVEHNNSIAVAVYNIELSGYLIDGQSFRGTDL